MLHRVTLLVEESRNQLSCLLNPENLVRRRQAGIQPRRSATGQLTGAGLQDDPLLYTGGGSTELDLDLLFDVSLAGSSIASDDVRDLTGPLWRLAENSGHNSQRHRPPLVWFTWGKAWSLPTIVVAVAERLEDFTPGGVPRRSWLRLRLQRVEAPALQPTQRSATPAPALFNALPLAGLRLPEAAVGVHPLAGGVSVTSNLLEGRVELSIGEALLTAGEIMASALSETAAGQMIASAVNRLSAAVSTALEAVKDWLATPSPAILAVKQGLQTLGDIAVNLGASLAAWTGAAAATVRSNVVGFAVAAKEHLLTAITGAAAEISLALGNVRTQLRQLVEPTQRALAAALDRLLEPLRPLARAVAQAAAIVAQAVKAKAQRIIAVAVPYLQSARQMIGASLDKLGEIASAAGTAAVQQARFALDVLGDALQQLRTGGQFLNMEIVAPALNQIALAVDVLWISGKRTAAKLIGGLVGRLTVAAKNMSEAGEALGQAAGRQANRLALAAANAFAVALARWRSGDSEQSTPPVEAWAAARAQIAALEPLLPAAAFAPVAAEMAPIESAESLKTDIQQQPSAEAESVQPPMQPLAIDAGNLLVALANLETSIEATVTATIEQAAQSLAESEAVRTTMALLSPSVLLTPPRPLAATERTLQTSVGERLDQLAYRYYQNPAFWRLLARFNAIDDPLHLVAGSALRVPPASIVGGSA
jgi:hypothetical protein